MKTEMMPNWNWRRKDLAKVMRRNWKKMVTKMGLIIIMGIYQKKWSPYLKDLESNI